MTSNQKDYEHFNQVLVKTGRIGVYDDGKNSKSRPAAFRRKQDAGRVEGTQKRRIDALAAAEILQAFLDSKKATENT